MDRPNEPESLPPYPLSDFLPIEMVDKIMLYLDQRERLAASSICSAWRQSMIHNAALWKNSIAPISAHPRYEVSIYFLKVYLYFRLLFYLLQYC
jgi:hypothetical protein